MGLVGWRGVFVVLSCATVIAALAVMLMVPDEPQARRKTSLRRELAGMRHALMHPFFVGVGPAVALIQGGFMAIQTLWAAPWLYDVAAVGREAIGGYLLLIAVGMVAGYSVTGFLAARLARWGIHPLAVSVSGAAVLLATQATLIVTGSTAPLALWLVFGFFGTSTTLCFAMIGHAVSPQYVGRVSTATNFLVFAAAFAFQWGMGAIVGLWPASPDGQYPAAAYQAAFSVALVAQLVGWLWLMRTAIVLRKTVSDYMPAQPEEVK